MALSENIFGVLRRWLLMGGGCLREVVSHGGSIVCMFTP